MTRFLRSCVLFSTHPLIQVSMLKACTIGAKLAKCDINSAFCLLLMNPEDFELLGFFFEGGYYVERALAMGCSIFCAAFELFSFFLEWALKRKVRSPPIVHYLDGFFFCGRQGTSQCLRTLQEFQDLAQELGVPLTKEKMEGPVLVLTYLRIEFDTVCQSSRLPEDKLTTRSSTCVACWSSLRSL